MINDACVGKLITKVVAIETGGGARDGEFDTIVFDKVASNDEVEKALTARKILESKRKGKQMWWKLSGSGPTPCFHFGMTGSFAVCTSDGEVCTASYKRYEIVPARCVILVSSIS